MVNESLDLALVSCGETANGGSHGCSWLFSLNDGNGLSTKHPAGIPLDSSSSTAGDGFQDGCRAFFGSQYCFRFDLSKAVRNMVSLVSTGVPNGMEVATVHCKRVDSFLCTVFSATGRRSCRTCRVAVIQGIISCSWYSCCVSTFGIAIKNSSCVISRITIGCMVSPLISMCVYGICGTSFLCRCSGSRIALAMRASFGSLDALFLACTVGNLFANVTLHVSWFCRCSMKIARSETGIMVVRTDIRCVGLADYTCGLV
mmetsp:Transcript_26726/g.42976  ORF Transcript_26726/g.42976 Transcript_26726/m.42976 type:complete len:258 (+) Transcript_26726:995-1768(+)